MVLRHEESVTKEQANKINKEVKALNNKNIGTAYTSSENTTYGIITISVNPCGLDEKIEASRILKEYAKTVRNRMLKDSL